MKKHIGDLFRFHLLPLCIGVCVTGLFMALFTLYVRSCGSPVQDEIISGTQQRVRGNFSNCVAGPQDELELAAALKNPRVLTIMGSSELGSDRYSSYFFLSDSLNMPAIGYGHAYHQSFSMYCELLAMEEFLDSSRICFVISPGWFDTQGTHTQAFLEFVRPAFLRSIATNPRLQPEARMEVARFVYEHRSEIEDPGPTLSYFAALYRSRHIPLYHSFVESWGSTLQGVKYEVKTADIPSRPEIHIDWDKRLKQLQDTFVHAVTNNELYVGNAYYSKYLLDEQGVPRKAKAIEPDPLATNRELADFMLLLNLLESRNVRASFVIQPLNPYYYHDLEKYNEIIALLEERIRSKGYPCFNMFVSDKKDYEPGTLRDIMHLGDYGWLKISRFLKTSYP